MNKVDLYVNGFRLDLFDDEEITINLSVQNVQDISKVFTDFTQGFTVPASPRNNEILQHYYNSNITSSNITTETVLNAETIFLSYEYRVLDDGGVIEGAACCIEAIDELGNSFSQTSTANTFDGRLRQEARIEINSLPFRTGVVEIENVQLKGTEPYAYTMTFYGDVVSLTDLFGEDYLYDLDFSAYNFDYTDDEVFDRFTTDDHDPIFMPLMSPVKNWFYDSGSGGSAHADNNIAHHTGGGHGSSHGINYYELKPAIKVTAVLSAIQAKYGITFTGSFISSAPFTDLSLWLHRREGYMYENQPAAMAWEKVVADVDNAPVNDIYQFSDDEFEPTISDVYNFSFSATITGYTADWEFAIIDTNGDQVVSQVTLNGSAVGAGIAANLVAGRAYYFAIRPTTTAVSPVLNYRFTSITASRSGIVGLYIDIEQTSTRAYGNTGNVFVSDQMPEMKVKDFLAGIIKMYNMVIQPSSPTSFLLQPLDDWYAAGTDQNYQTYFDITEYTVNRPPLYREIEFKYQETDQILGAQYRNTNNIGYGDLRAFFNFDAENFVIETPFECPLFERLTDVDSGDLTDILVYKSITNELADDGVSFKPYLGAPILFYAKYDLDISEFPVSFVDSDGTTERVVETCWYANVSNSTTAAIADTITFGADIDPYHLQSINNNLYNDYWSDYITDLYAKSRRLYQVEAVLPIGKIITMNLKNAVIWNNAKYIVNSVQLNMTTGKATLELLNVV
jgi:hypothetical protein